MTHAQQKHVRMTPAVSFSVITPMTSDYMRSIVDIVKSNVDDYDEISSDGWVWSFVSAKYNAGKKTPFDDAIVEYALIARGELLENEDTRGIDLTNIIRDNQQSITKLDTDSGIDPMMVTLLSPESGEREAILLSFYDTETGFNPFANIGAYSFYDAASVFFETRVRLGVEPDMNDRKEKTKETLDEEEKETNQATENG